MGSWCEDVVSSVWKKWLEWSQPAPWAQLLLSICGKYSNLYLVQTYGLLIFQLSPWHTSTSNLFCPNRIHAFPFPPNLFLSQLSIALSEHLYHSSSCEPRIMASSSIPSSSLSASKELPTQQMLLRVVLSPGILPPKDSDALSSATTLPPSYFNHHLLPWQVGHPAYTPASQQFVFHTATRVNFSKSLYDHKTH